MVSFFIIYTMITVLEKLYVFLNHQIKSVYITIFSQKNKRKGEKNQYTSEECEIAK